jgi:hypothetical protein
MSSLAPRIVDLKAPLGNPGHPSAIGIPLIYCQRARPYLVLRIGLSALAVRYAGSLRIGRHVLSNDEAAFTRAGSPTSRATHKDRDLSRWGYLLAPVLRERRGRLADRGSRRPSMASTRTWPFKRSSMRALFQLRCAHHRLRARLPHVSSFSRRRRTGDPTTQTLMCE